MVRLNRVGLDMYVGGLRSWGNDYYLLRKTENLCSVLD